MFKYWDVIVYVRAGVSQDRSGVVARTYNLCRVVLIQADYFVLACR